MTLPPGREAPSAFVIAKAPRPGRAKTRLAASIGAAPAAALASAMLLDTLDGCRSECSDVIVLCPTREDVPFLTELAGPDVQVIVQQGAGLGDALTTGIRYARSRGRVALLVSSDLPGLPRGSLETAAALLGDGVDVVLGPGHDGGYWLLGLRAEHPGILAGIPWSTDDVLEATISRCVDLGLDARLLEPWRDIDTAEDIAALDDLFDTLPGTRTRNVLADMRSAASAPLTQEVATP